jgi:serine/threonine-protein kinase
MKPENVMVLQSNDRTDRIKVLDFGIALVNEGEGVPRLTDAGSVRGTPLYMSPEQCRGRDVGTPTDVYAVGIMIHELFAGKPPFQGETAADLTAQHLYVDPPHLDPSDGVIPVGLDALVRRALSKRAADRPTAAQLRDELAQVFRGTDATAIAVRAAAERVRMAHLSRDERAITRKPAVPPSVAPASTGAVMVIAQDELRWREIRDLLSVHGMSVARWSENIPTPSESPQAPGVVIVVANTDASSLVSKLRATWGARLPLLVLDVESPEQTTGLIRAGASDVAMRSIAAAEIPRKVSRLLRRGR